LICTSTAATKITPKIADQIAASFGFGRSFTKPGHGDGIAAGFA
jgi:hypothetical protein